jgi:hypothetical protein
MEDLVTFKEFLYRSSLAVVCKSPLNFGTMIISVMPKVFNQTEELNLEDILSKIPQKENQLTQMEKVQRQNVIRVAIVDEKAYFVHENTFYTAKLVDGEVDRASASPINAYDMSKKEMNMLLSILDNMYS